MTYEVLQSIIPNLVNKVKDSITKINIVAINTKRSNGKKSIKYDNAIGIMPNKKYGCLLPNLFVLSEITPIIGSVNASTNNAIKIAKTSRSWR